MLRPEFQHLADIERRRIVMPKIERLRLSRLEKPEPWPSDLQQCFEHALRLDMVQEYPDYPPFYDLLARFVGVSSDRVVVGAGIEEFIRTLMFLSAGPGDKVAILWPTCAMFEIYARAFGIELVRIVPCPGEPMTAEDLADRLPSDVKMLLLANPGQPVETCFDVQGLRFLAECCRSADAVFAVDEAYYGFGAPTALGLIDGFDNLVVLRTFSKAFGAAGIRVGFSVAGPRLTGALNAVRQSGEVSSLSMAVATVLIQQSDFVADSTAKIVRARDWLRARVSQDLGLNVWGRWANHVLIEFPSAETCGRVNALLAARGVLVKAGFQAPIDRHMLVTCGPMQLMTVFYSELKDAISCV